MSRRPAVLVARAVFGDIVDRLRVHFEVEDNPADRIYSKAELIEHLKGKAGAFITGSERIDAEVLVANPQLRAVCNMAVGYNNIDIDACNAILYDQVTSYGFTEKLKGFQTAMDAVPVLWNLQLEK